MDKRIIIVFLLIIIAIISAVIFNKVKEKKTNEPEIIIIDNNIPISLVDETAKEKEEDKAVEVTDSDMIEKIKEESYLNILLQIQSFDSLYINYEPLLEAAMRIASMQGLVEMQTEDVYLEYVPKSVIHDIIYELSGVRVEEPIEIDDYYYLYDEEHDYYYVVPIGVNWLQLNEIQSISCYKNDQYTIKCSGRMGSEDSGVVSIYPEIEVKLKYKPSNKYIKYQIISISVGEPNIEVS